MPCRGPDDDGVRVDPMTLKRLHDIEAMLCGFIKAINKTGRLAQVLDTIEWKTAGVGRAAFEQWWGLHQREDASRDAADKAAAHRGKLRQTALNKLTADEAAALGIKK